MSADTRCHRAGYPRFLLDRPVGTVAWSEKGRQQHVEHALRNLFAHGANRDACRYCAAAWLP